MMKTWISTFGLLLWVLSMQGQQAGMADQMRADGKIYVVVGVMVLIFAVLFAYLIYMDVRLRKVENENKQS